MRPERKTGQKVGVVGNPVKDSNRVSHKYKHTALQLHKRAQMMFMKILNVDTKKIHNSEVQNYNFVQLI
jgi:hypothetical protein